MKHIAILGSTGSIGSSALAVARAHKDKFRIVALSANSDTGALSKQIKEFRPTFVCINDPRAAACFKTNFSSGLKIFFGEEGLVELVRQKEIDMVLVAISGSAALKPLLAAIDAKKDIALANKEALVMAGDLVMKRAKTKGVTIIPVDSEQSAIWQCLKSEERSDIEHIYLTASGGPLKDITRTSLRNISLSRVLKHPRWSMGKKITVDSATMMNKGLELLEAMFLFNVPLKKVRIIIHPEAIVHSMVEFVDGVILAQLSATDMRIPIQYALSYPKRLTGKIPRLDFPALKTLHFEKPDFRKFPCLGLAVRSAEKLGTMPTVMNAANEVSVGEFLKHKLKFNDIARVIERVMDRHRNITRPGLGEIFKADLWARIEAVEFIKRSKLKC